MIDSQQLKFIKDLAWNEVFDFWKKNEAWQKGWQELSKELGYATCDEWRMSYAKRFHCLKLNWLLYEIERPTETVSQFWGGPFSGWAREHYRGKVTKSFRELAESPDLQKNPKVQEMLEKFPNDTVMTGIQVGDRIYIIEGMHRSVTLSIMARNKTEFSGRVFLALAQSNEQLKYEPRIRKEELEKS